MGLWQHRLLACFSILLNLLFSLSFLSRGEMFLGWCKAKDKLIKSMTSVLPCRYDFVDIPNHLVIAFKFLF